MPDNAGGNEKPLDGATVIELVPSIAPESFGLGYVCISSAVQIAATESAAWV
jgi:hypothetical protein